MGIYRGAGGTGDAINDASSEAAATILARDAAIAAKTAAEAAQAGAVVSEANAATSAIQAATSASNAASSATTALGAISSTQAAATQATDAKIAAQAAQTAAEVAKTSAETAAVNANSSASSASSSASNASSSATTATTQAGIATTQANNALASANSAAASYDQFDDRYLGSKASDPTLDNDGNTLLDGALYFDTTNNVMKVYDLGNTTWRRTTPTSSDQIAIDAVNANAANITTVAANIFNVNSVGTNITNVNTVATNITNVNTVATNISNVTTVGNNITTVNTVASGIIPTRVLTVADGTSISINADLADFVIHNNTQAAGTLTINAPTGTLVNGQRLVLRIRSSNVQTLAWNAAFTDSDDLDIATTTSGSSKYDYFGFFYNTTVSKWQLVSQVQGF